MITLIVAQDELVGGTVTVSGDAYRHLFRARRAAVGERVRLVDGFGLARWGVIARAGRETGEILVGEAAPANDPALEVDLLVPLPKPDRLSWLVEKASELGVRRLRFVSSARAPRELGSGALERLRRVAASALEQCHGSRLPEISGVHPWSERESWADSTAQRFVLQPGSPALAAIDAGRGPVALLVGPEGGFDPNEIAELEAEGWQRRGLGVRVLRLETAAILGAGTLLAAT